MARTFNEDFNEKENKPKYALTNMELADVLSKRYGIPKDQTERILFSNENLNVVKFAKNKDFISQQCLAYEIAKLLNVEIHDVTKPEETESKDVNS